MKLELQFGTSLCFAPTFKINDKDADADDFGEKYDRSPETAEDYACGDMRFTRIPPTAAVLSKYGITIDEYHEIATRLEEGLSFGCCGWCV